MSKLIVVSNRVSLPGAGAEAGGGLAVALKEALASKGGIWCGWSGKSEEYPRTCKQADGNIQYMTMDLSFHDYKNYYSGFCNSMLWPAFHYRLDLSHFEAPMFESYEAVNRQFAEKVASVTKPGDVIWAHDYHLMTFARHLREMGVKERMGFFLHIPFPVPEIFAALPSYMEIMKGLCAYDVLGFQTDIDLQAFIRCVTELAGARAVKSVHENMFEVQVFGRSFKAGRFSISIDTADLMMAADRAAIAPKTLQLKKSLMDRALLIGVDRLDYTKGLVQRLQAYGELLKTHPEYLNKVSYVQITPPSRTDVESYGDIRHDMESLAARINGVNADIDWVPLRYINKSFTRNELSGFYRTARVGLVTPLRDGMNLVAKEYVASQNPDDPGVLLLSRFAGASHELGCGALLINPYNAEETAAQMHRALSMAIEERRERYEAMIAVLKKNDIFLWSKRFLNHLTNQAEKDKIIVWQQRHPTTVSVSIPKKVPMLVTQNM